MTKSIELLDEALETRSASELARQLKTNRSTIATAKMKGRISPALAGNLAIDLGADPLTWIAIAALEGERKSPLLTKLELALDFSNALQKRKSLKNSVVNL